MTALTASEDHAIVMTITYESETKGLTMANTWSSDSSM